MRETWKLNLRIFDGGAGTGAAGGAGAAGGDAGAGSISAEGTPAGITILEDGTQVDRRLAERMEKQRKRHPERAARGAANPAGQNGQAQQPAAGQQAENEAQTAKTPEEEFEELIHGKYRDQYQARFQNGISERFKNQADLQKQLDGLKPMLDALAKQRGIPEGDYEALSRNILDDDSLYEEEAEAAGMTVEAYKTFQQMKAEAEAARAREQEDQQQAAMRQHLQKLINQGEELKKVFPDFDLRRELNDPHFRRMVDPTVGLSVEQAYYAVHHAELGPQAYAAGIQRAQRQIGQTLQANAARPVEGAMQGSAAASDIHISPRNMTRAERQALRERARRGEEIVL